MDESAGNYAELRLITKGHILNYTVEMTKILKMEDRIVVGRCEMQSMWRKEMGMVIKGQHESYREIENVKYLAYKRDT